TALAAVSPGDEFRYGLVVWERGGKLVSGDVEEYKKGLASSLKGWTLGDVEMKPSDVPVPGSVSIRATPEDPGGPTMDQYSYLIPGKWTYTAMTMTNEVAEPRQFSQFVRSLRFLDPAGNAPKPDTGTGIAVLLAVVGAVFDWKYIRRGGRRPTKTEYRNLGI